VCFLWHFPWGRPRWLLTSALPFGVRTFLPGPDVRPRRPPDPLREHPIIRLFRGSDEAPARQGGEIPANSNPRRTAGLLVDWEGAALRSHLRRDAAPLKAVLDFFLRSAGAR